MKAVNWETFQKQTMQDLEKINRGLNPADQQPKGMNEPFFATGARCYIKFGGRPLGYCQNFQWSVSYNSQAINTVDTVFPWDIDVGLAQITANLTKIVNPFKGPEAENLFPVMAAAVHQPMVELQVIYKTKIKEPVFVEAELVMGRNRLDAGTATASAVELGGVAAGPIGGVAAGVLITNRFNKLKQKTETIKATPVEFSMFFARGMFTGISSEVSLGKLTTMNANFLGVAYQHYVSQAFVPYGVSYILQEGIMRAQEAVGAITGGFM